MKVDADFTRGASRLIYPELPDPLTSADLKRFFSPSPRRTRVGAYHCPFVNLPGGVVGSIDGLPSRLAPQIKDAHRRYVFTTFAYGCGLGPTQAARHLNGVVSADQLSFVDRRHIDIADLRAASADLINLYAKFELPQQWGVGEAAVADGTHFETQEDNLLAERHIRYGKTGGIAYRHIADNYIALFSRFIACGTYEATYILDALLENLSDLKPRRLHADTHGQSAVVFGLAYLLDIELMPRIRRWRKLRLCRADPYRRYPNIDALFSGNVNWALIREHYGMLMQLALAIQGGTLAPRRCSRGSIVSAREIALRWRSRNWGSRCAPSFS
jgi:Tn3 transposase DDE domain